jgi:hypothetical protein
LPSIQKATVARKPDHREEHEAAVNPLRAERRVFWCICGDYARLSVFGRRKLRVHQAPGVPTPSLLGVTTMIYLARKNLRGEIAKPWPLDHSPPPTGWLICPSFA